MLNLLKMTEMKLAKVRTARRRVCGLVLLLC